MLIGLYGAAGSGKDTAAERLVSHHGFTRFAFADALKELATRIGWNGEKDEAGRKLLQDLGHGAREILGTNVWVNALSHAIDRHALYVIPCSAHYVITDVRYPNEVEFVRDRGGLLVLVTRPGLDTSAPMYAHPTETNIRAFAPDRVIVNDSTIEALHRKMDSVVYTAMPRVGARAN